VKQEGLRYVAGVDYIRVTYSGGNLPSTVLGYYQHTAWVAGTNGGADTAKTEPWAWQGYTGAKAGAAAWGVREDGIILQVSGAAAARVSLHELPHTGVPRLDIQLTLWGAPSPSSIPRAIAERSAAAREGANGRPWKVRLVDGYGAGDTAYLGSRESLWFVRVYDKERESGQKQYEGAVRYEVEMHDEHAEACLQSLAQAEDVQEAAARFVVWHLDKRGASLPSGVSLEGIPVGRVPREPTPTERTLQWLSEGVQPSLRRLEATGIAPGALRAVLGLDLPRLPRRKRYVKRKSEETRLCDRLARHRESW
jgi:hypothetical protein